MGANGKAKSNVKSFGGNEFVNEPTEDENDLDGYTEFKNSKMSDVDKWFANPKLSNYSEWEKSLGDDGLSAVHYYTGAGFDNLNEKLYTTPWDEIPDNYKTKATNLYNAINKFELNKAIQVSRATHLHYFGNSHDIDELRNYLTKNGGVLQFNGFQSASTGPNPAFSGELVIHYKIPPSKGAGAYTRPLSMHPSEREFTINNNAVVKFDMDSLHKEGHRIHINAEWLGQAADQAFASKK